MTVWDKVRGERGEREERGERGGREERERGREEREGERGGRGSRFLSTDLHRSRSSGPSRYKKYKRAKKQMRGNEPFNWSVY